MALDNPYGPPASESSVPPALTRSDAWRWSICVLLLLATVVNYMDRQTASSLSTEIQAEFRLNNEQYGNLEQWFGFAFAAGSLLFGWLVDRVGVYWLYPAVLIGWSAMGFLTGLSRNYEELVALRVLLGLFEAGHFPCGLKTVQQIMRPGDRALGNSLLQGGTALGAILAPQAIRLMMTPEPDAWRYPFMVIGAGGTAWVVLWFLALRPSDLRDHFPADADADGASGHGTAKTGWPGFWRLVFSRRYLALAIMVICINLNWHLWRAWLPKFLRETRGYDRDSMLNFTTYYYLAADVPGS